MEISPELAEQTVQLAVLLTTLRNEDTSLTPWPAGPVASLTDLWNRISSIRTSYKIWIWQHLLSASGSRVDWNLIYAFFRHVNNDGCSIPVIVLNFHCNEDQCMHWLLVVDILRRRLPFINWLPVIRSMRIFPDDMDPYLKGPITSALIADYEYIDARIEYVLFALQRRQRLSLAASWLPSDTATPEYEAAREVLNRL